MSTFRIARRALLGSGAVTLMRSLAQARPRPIPSPSKQGLSKRGLPLVVLDPGHGGKDPGAIGYSGTYEKHVSLRDRHGTAAPVERMPGRFMPS